MQIVTTPLVVSILLGLSWTGTRFVDGENPKKIVKTPPPTASPVSSNNIFVSNIYGGTMANRGDYPYFVQFSGCGGALIAPDIALTAAHCGDQSGYELYIGAYKTESTEYGAQERTCVQWMGHPGWDSINDVALCKLSSPVTIDESKVKLELNRDPDLSIVGEDLVAMGFGLLDGEFNIPTFLQRTDLQGRNCYTGEVELVCAGGHDGEDGKTDVCRGDSGGPLMRIIPRSDGPDIHYHIGAVSFGAYCPEAPTGYYARTSAMISWIDQTMCEMNSVNCRGGSNPTPTQAPVTECEDDQSSLVISVVTDMYCTENEWLLERKTSGGQWETVQQNGLDESEKMFTTNVCLDADTWYRWTITDEYSDGLCDSNGNNCGSILITLNSEELVSSNGDFGSEVVEEFKTPLGQAQQPTNPPIQKPPTPTQAPPTPTQAPPTPTQAPPTPTQAPPTPTNPPATDCEDDQSSLVIKVQTDLYSIENEWVLEKTTGAQWLDVDQNSLDADATTFTTNVCLEGDILYRWIITDEFGDGLCDPFGNCGSFSITLNGEEIVSSNGSFQFEFMKEFKAPLGRAQEPTTNTPTQRQPTKRPKQSKKGKKGKNRRRRF